MKIKSIIILFFVCIIALFTTFCQNNLNEPIQIPSHVKIKATNGKYHFFVNGVQFDIKGVGLGLRNYAYLHNAGANSIRTWSANNGRQILDSARRYGFMVAMGLGMGQELHGFNYKDTVAVARQFNEIKKSVEALKNHPNLLCWVAGNELNLKSGGVPVNPKVYDALKDIVDYIHNEDPYHPVTTTFAGVKKEQIQVAMEHCPNLDFLSLQVYGSLGDLPELVKAAGIKKPYAVTEYGARGHWEGPITAWGREIEETSSVKAGGIMDRIQKGIVNDSSGLCLGGYAFVWGYKQERTPTWFGIFLKTGEATAIVDELTKYWSGKYPANRAPKVDSLKLDGKNAIDNIYLSPGTICTAKVFASDPDNNPITYKWVLSREVKVRGQGGSRELEPENINIDVLSDINGEIKFKLSNDVGEFRLYCYILDNKNKAGTANVPFFVK